MIKLQKNEKRKGIQVSKRFLLLLVFQFYLLGLKQRVSSSLSLLRQWLIHQNFYFSSIPANPNVYPKISVFSDPQLKKDTRRNSPNTPFTIEQLFVNDEGKLYLK